MKINYRLFTIYDWLATRIEKIMLYMGVAALFFLATPAANATTQLMTQSWATGACGDSFSYGLNFSWTYYTQRLVTNSKNNLNKLTVNFGGKNPQRTIVFYLCKGATTGSANDATCTGSGQSVAGYESKVVASSTGMFDWIPAEPIKIDSTSSPYFISLTGASSFAIDIRQSGDSQIHCYTYDIAYPFGGWNVSWYNTRWKSLAFYAYYDDGYGNLSDLSTQMVTPSGNVGLSSPVFTGYYRDDNRLAAALNVKIYNKDLNQTIIKSFSLASTSVATGTREFGPVTEVQTFMNYSMVGSAEWSAYLVNATGTQISAAVTPKAFQIGTSTILANMSWKADDVCIDDDRSTLTGLVSCAFKTAIAWTFYPSQNALDTIKTSGQAIKNSFPFNVYFQLTDTVSSTIASTTLSTNGSVGLPMIRADKSIYIASFISSSSLPKAVGSSNATLIRNTITWLIWLALALGLFFEFKKI